MEEENIHRNEIERVKKKIKLCNGIKQYMFIFYAVKTKPHANGLYINIYFERWLTLDVYTRYNCTVIISTLTVERERERETAFSSHIHIFQFYQQYKLGFFNYIVIFCSLRTSLFNLDLPFQVCGNISGFHLFLLT